MSAPGGDPPPLLERGRRERSAAPERPLEPREDPPPPPLADPRPSAGPPPRPLADPRPSAGPPPRPLADPRPVPAPLPPRPSHAQVRSPRPPLPCALESPATPFAGQAQPEDPEVEVRELPLLHAERGFGAHIVVQIGHERPSLTDLLRALSIDNPTLDELFGGIIIAETALVYDRSAFAFRVTLALERPIQGQLELELYLGPERGGFAGRLKIERASGSPLTLSLLADKSRASTSLMARCEGSFDLLAELLPAVFPAFEVPAEDLGIQVSDPLFVLAPGADGAPTRVIVGAHVEVDTSFGRLPLAGEALDGRLGLDLNLVYASAPFSAEEVEGLVELGAQLPVPARGELRGLQVAFGLVLDGQVNELVVDLGGGRSQAKPPPTPEAPAPEAPAEPRRPVSPGAKIFWFELDKTIGPVSLRRIGGGYGEGKVQLRVDAGFELAGLGFSMSGLGLGFRLTSDPDELELEPHLDGLSLSLTRGGLVIAGAFLRRDAYEDALGRTVEFRFDGAVVVRTPVVELAALGSYARVRASPAAPPLESLFLYAYVGAEAGIGNSIIKVTGLALGMGAHQRVNVPHVSRVKDFSLVKLVMGGGPASGAEDSGLAYIDGLIESMAERDLSPSPGEFFGCLGLRFTLFETIDCFALLIVRYHDVLEFNLVGLAHLDLPRGSKDDPKVQQLCHAELQLVATLSLAGFVQVEARLSDESWVFSEACKLRGGFALFAWWAGEHAGDFVLSLGGYHPAFRRPSHYPLVPRVSLEWVVSDELSIQGSVYLALTPACIMAGGRLRAAFESGDIKARFDAYFDVLISWRPVYFDLRMGITIAVELSLAALTLSFRLGVHLQMWGPELGGLCTVEVEPLFSFDIPFGADKAPPAPLTWPEFGRNFIDREDLDGQGKAIAADPANRAASGKWARPTRERDLVPGPRVVSPRLIAGDARPAGPRTQAEPPDPRQAWVVDPDSLEIGVRTAVPLTRLATGECEELDALRARSAGGADLSMLEAIKLAPGTTRELARTHPGQVGVHPMNQRLDSRLKISLVREDGPRSTPMSLADWTTEARRERLPRALWNRHEPGDEDLAEPAPDDALVEDCITGVDLLKPPLGHAHGDCARLDVNQLEARSRDERAAPRPRRTKRAAPSSSPSAKLQGWGAWLLDSESEAS